MSGLLSLAEAAARLGVSKSTAFRILPRVALPGVRRRLYDPADIDMIIANGKRLQEGQDLVRKAIRERAATSTIKRLRIQSQGAEVRTKTGKRQAKRETGDQQRRSLLLGTTGGR